MDTKRIKEIGEELREARIAVESAGLPEQYRKDAFNELMKKIIHGGGEIIQKRQASISGKRRNSKIKTTSKNVKDETEKIESEIERLVEILSRTKHSVVYKLESAIEQSLYLLKIAEEEGKISGLTPTQISKVLRDVFRINKSPNAISMAMLKAVDYADRKKITAYGVAAYRYQIMHKGEEFIKERLKEMKEKVS